MSQFRRRALPYWYSGGIDECKLSDNRRAALSASNFAQKRKQDAIDLTAHAVLTCIYCLMGGKLQQFGGGTP